MRILYCVAEAPLPPLSDGYRLAVRELFEVLRRHHQVRVLGYRLPDQRPLRNGELDAHLVPRSYPTGVRKAWQYAAATVHRRPAEVDALADPLRHPLRVELHRFDPDLVHVHSTLLAGLGPELAGRPTVLTTMDALYLNIDAKARLATGPRRWAARDEYRRVRRFEATAYRSFDRVVVVSEADRAALQALDPTLPVEVIPNGVDYRFWSAPGPDRPEPDRIMFHGVLSWPPNVAAAEFLAREVLPRVRARRPGAHAVLVGRAPAARLRALAAEDDGVQVTGEVPDVRPWLRGSRVYVCAMFSGTGIKNKLLEAMASGLPCVATPLALQGMRARPGRDVLVAETPEGLATQVVRLLDDESLAASLGRAARAYVRAEHDWDAVARRYDDLYRAILA